MKRKLALLFASTMIVCIGHGQDIDSLTLSKLRLNFTVPDMPAFKTLGTEPSNLLKPSNTKELAVSLSSFSQDGKFVIPQAFAIEIAPALLLNPKKKPVPLADYAKKRVLNGLRISLGSSTDTTLSPSGRNLALGLRVSLINQGDLIYDTKKLEEISDRLRIFRNDMSKCFRDFANDNLDSVKNWANDTDPNHTHLDSVIDGDSFMKEKIKSDSLWRAKFEAYKEFCLNSFDSWMASLKSNYKKKNWNANKLDFALAILSSSPDSLVKHIRFNKAALWLTGAIKTGKNSQLLLGLNAQTFKNLKSTEEVSKNKSYFEVSIPARYLIGTNRIKGFAEAQYSYTTLQKENKVLLNLGSEINIADGLWLNFYGGLDYSSVTKQGSFITNFNMKLTLPEKFNLF